MSSSNTPAPSQVKGTTSQKGKAPLRRRGPKGYFQGSRKEFLESRLPEYKTYKRGNRQAFWYKLYCAWWQRFPWRLSDDEEPPSDNSARMANLGAVAPGEEGRKKQVEGRLTERLTHWFVNHASASSTTRHETSAWLPLLERLHKIRNPRPRCRTAVQQFMLDRSSDVDAALVKQYPDSKGLSNSHKMNLRYEVAKFLLTDRRYSHLVDGLERKAAAQHKTDMNTWSLALDDTSMAEDASQARDTLFDAVHPLLQAIGSYVGCYVSLIAGSPETDGDKGFFTAVHWWPGDRGSTKDWTQWNESAFNVGVAGPFLKYAAETDQLLQAPSKTVVPPPAIQTPGVTPSPTLPKSVPIIDDTLSAGAPPSTHNGSATTTTTRGANYRPRPLKKQVPVPVEDAKKRKRINKSRPIRYYEGSESDEDDANGLSDDGSSSGESLSDGVPTHAKRQRTSRIVTRSSTQDPGSDAGTEGGEIATSQALALTTQLLPVIPDVDAPNLVDNSLTDTAAMSINPLDSNTISADAMNPVVNSLTGTPVNSPGLQSVGVSAGAVGTNSSFSRSVLRASSGTLSSSGDTSSTGTQVTRDMDTPLVADAVVSLDTNTPPVVDAVVSPNTDVEVSTTTTRVTAGAATEFVVGAASSVGSFTISPTITSRSFPPPVLSNDIDMDSVPDFLRSHGKGKREVDIFNYLNKVKDPRFQQVLRHYILLEAEDRSRTGGTLPTAKRPTEISQWSSRARPDTLPDFTKGKRTFQDFVDSTLTWWDSIQPDWRSFERRKVSRKVCGGWAVLDAPRINGLLNVVILVYWWVRLLEEQKPKDAVRADYEKFADDVAWVFSNISN